MSRYLAWLSSRPDPTNTVLFGVARSLVAAGLLLTQLATPSSVLNFRSANYPEGVVCDPVGGNNILLPCLLPLGSGASFARAIGVVVLALVVVGWRPRWTALPFWYVTVSLVATSPLPDGGDHLAIVIATLLTPVGVLDSRRWIWQPVEDGPGPSVRGIVARTTQLALLAQIGFVYAHASLAKLTVDEWRDGTALWYWSRQATFGFPDWLREVSDPVLATGPGVAALTHGTLVVELFIAAAVLRGRAWQSIALVAGVAFHAAIALAMGLVSFFFSVAGLLLLGFGTSLRSVIVQRCASARDRCPTQRRPAKQSDRGGDGSPVSSPPHDELMPTGAR